MVIYLVRANRFYKKEMKTMKDLTTLVDIIDNIVSDSSNDNNQGNNALLKWQTLDIVINKQKGEVEMEI